MIYPTIYKYNAPYRGPKSAKEINKVLTTVAHDSEEVYKELTRQAEMARENHKHGIGLSDTFYSENMTGYTETGDFSQGFKGLVEMEKSIRDMDRMLDAYLRNL
jgi:hypothetical protein